MAPKKNIPTTPSPSAVPPTAAKPNQAVSSAAGQPTRAANKPSTTNSSHVRNTQDLQQIAVGVWNNYVDNTVQRVKLLDAFLVFLMTVGLLQFVYAVVGGNFVSLPGRLSVVVRRYWRSRKGSEEEKGSLREQEVVVSGKIYFMKRSDRLTYIRNIQPFNAFLSGFSATVGQFVLTVSLRMQTNPENKADFESISHERYVSCQSIGEGRVRDVIVPSVGNCQLCRGCVETRAIADCTFKTRS